MATGGDKLTGFIDPAIVDKKDTGLLVRDVFIAAVKEMGTITPTVGNNWTISTTPVAMEQTDKASPTAGTKLQVTASWLNLRTGAGLDYNVVGSIPRGTVVDLLSASGDCDKINFCSD